MKPVIGITPSPFVATTGAGELERYAIAACYVKAVLAAGGIPIVLPPQDGNVESILELVDGLLFSGGADIDPAIYGDSDVHPTTYDIHPLRDRFELDLIKRAVEDDIPTFCICRGIQVLNVACGGTLYQHVPDQHTDAIPHRQGETGHRNHESSHTVVAEPGSLLSAAYGATEIPVNSYHHQAVKDVAPGLHASAASPDGLVESVEIPGKRFVLGVQWHPEMMFESDPLHLAPFRQLVEAAAARRLAGVDR
ncbi:MAG: gamma-glutamyl-gamma-aminobutyrate hydrolase family protein [Thermomicrobiales bacterium]|nr:gamma-glutamyl-gamma-aminobutyrate hydrolase family protein [Thermomicrobiales bacterium]